MLLGCNGVGKISMLCMLMGLWIVSVGMVMFKGEDFMKLLMLDIVLCGIVYVLEIMGIFGELMVVENLLLVVWSVCKLVELDLVWLDWLFGFFLVLKIFWVYLVGKLLGG